MAKDKQQVTADILTFPKLIGKLDGLETEDARATKSNISQLFEHPNTCDENATTTVLNDSARKILEQAIRFPARATPELVDLFLK